jgi:hypothetical protein
MNTRKPEKSPQTAAGTAADQGRVADQSFASNASQELGIDDVGSLIQKIGVTSTAEFEKLIGELQQARSYLESEGERIQRKAVDYAELSQAASSSLKVISETVAEWRKAGHPVRNTDDGTAGPAQWLLLTASSDCEA